MRWHALPVFLCLGFAAVACLGQEPTTPATAPRELLRVHCTDADGKPVAGAEVHVWQKRRMPDGSGSMIGNGPFTSDEAGIAATATAIDYDGGRFDRWVYARVAGKLVGALRQIRFDDGPVDGKLVVTLLPVRELRGRVSVPEGVRPETVRIRVRTLSQIVGEEVFGQVFPRQMDLAAFENTLPERFDCQVAKDGTFVLADMPSKPFVVLAASGPGLAELLWGNAMLPERRVPDSIELQLAPESRFGGMVTDARGLAVTGASVELRISREAKTPATASFLAHTDAVGRFQIDGLPAGPFELIVKSPAGVVRPQRVNLAAAESRLDAVVELEDGIEVAGVITARPGDEPVGEVGVVAITPDDHLQLQLGTAWTDLQGRFSMRLPTGGAKLYFGRVPRGFVYPAPQIVATLDVARDDKELQKLRFALERAK